MAFLSFNLGAGIKRIIRLLSLVVFGIAFGSLLGHIRHTSVWYTWGAELGMGFPTSVCFLLVAVALFIGARED